MTVGFHQGCRRPLREHCRSPVCVWSVPAASFRPRRLGFCRRTGFQGEDSLWEVISGIPTQGVAVGESRGDHGPCVTSRFPPWALGCLH